MIKVIDGHHKKAALLLDPSACGTNSCAEAHTSAQVLTEFHAKARQAGLFDLISAFKDLLERRKVLIHINNSNPVLLDDSPESADVRARGWAIGYDGMRIAL